MAYSIDLQWKSFNVDLPSVDAWVKANTNSGYAGNSADSDLTLWFSQDPSIVPMSAAIAASASEDGETISAVTPGAAGNVSLTADGTSTLAQLVAAWNQANPANQLQLSGAGSEVPAAGPIVLTGGVDAAPSGQSDEQKVEAYWAAMNSASAEAVAYASKAAAASYQAQAQAAVDFGAAMLVQFAGQNLQLGITQAGMTKTVRVAMQSVTDCLNTGSLIEAISEIKAIPQGSYDSTFITAARLLAACNQLEKFCGLPLSTSLS